MSEKVLSKPAVTFCTTTLVVTGNFLKTSASSCKENVVCHRSKVLGEAGSAHVTSGKALEQHTTGLKGTSIKAIKVHGRADVKY